MAKKQTRRSISVRGTTYVRLREHCADKALSMSDFVEQRIAEFFGDPASAMKPAVKAQPVKARPAASPPLKAVVRPVEMKPSLRAVAQVSPIRPLASRAVLPTKKVAPVPLRVAASPAPLKPPEASGRIGAGRPAPTPARQVLKVREAVATRDDYRAIRF